MWFLMKYVKTIRVADLNWPCRLFIMFLIWLSRLTCWENLLNVSMKKSQDPYASWTFNIMVMGIKKFTLRWIQFFSNKKTLCGSIFFSNSFLSRVSLSSAMVYFLLVVVIVYCWASPRSYWFERSIACNNATCHLYVVIYLPFITLHFMCHTKLVACHLSFALHATHQVFNVLLALHVTCHLDIYCHLHTFCPFAFHATHQICNMWLVIYILCNTMCLTFHLHLMQHTKCITIYKLQFLSHMHHSHVAISRSHIILVKFRITLLAIMTTFLLL
jgi:hypothetical protein